jgi:allantoicase
VDGRLGEPPQARPGHDWCVVRLGVPGLVAGFEIDTRHFTGNYPPGAEIEVCRSDETVPGDEAGWTGSPSASCSRATTASISRSSMTSP